MDQSEIALTSCGYTLIEHRRKIKHGFQPNSSDFGVSVIEEKHSYQSAFIINPKEKLQQPDPKAYIYECFRGI